MSSINVCGSVRLDHIHKVILLSKRFQNRASVYGTEECNELCRVAKQFPEYEVTAMPPHRRKGNAPRYISYSKMQAYIGMVENSDDYRAKFNIMREYAQSQSSPYQVVFKWFCDTFPKYTETPQFTKEGKIAV